MTRRNLPRKQPKEPTTVFTDAGLTELGLCPGDRVRFRRREDENWTYATVIKRERDGSVGLTDRDGRARAIDAERIEVEGAGPRGGLQWQSLSERQVEDRQLRLL